MPHTQASATTQAMERRAARDMLQDRLFRGLLLACAMLVLVTMLGAAGSTLWGGRQAFARFGWHFLSSAAWDPGSDVYGAVVPVFGTLVTSCLALLIAVPISFGVAFFLTEVAPRQMRGPIAAGIELLAGVPSIIYGMWGLFIFAPFFADHIKPWLSNYLGNQPDDGHPSWLALHIPLLGKLFGSSYPFGASVLSAGIVLAVMVVPFISSVMREVFQTVPQRLKESAYALGASRWEVVWDIVVPYTRSAVIGGIFLGLGRALGETMAVTFVLGNSMNLSISLLDPGSSIASTIANQFSEAVDLQKSALMALAFLLFVVTFIVLLIARLMLRGLAAKEGKA